MNCMCRHIQSSINRWIETRFPKPGAENYAYDTLQLDMNYVIGNINYSVLHELRTGPVPFTMQQQVIPTGLPGIVAGQLVSQPLLGEQTNQIIP